jgi:hypothetical protein
MLADSGRAISARVSAECKPDCVTVSSARGYGEKFSVTRSNSDLSATARSAEIADYRARRGSSPNCIEVDPASCAVCRQADLIFRPRNPLEASDGMGELRAGSNNAACAAKSAKSSQLCGDANYSRVHAEGEPASTPHNGSPYAAVFHSRDINGRDGNHENSRSGSGGTHAAPTTVREGRREGESSFFVRLVALISKVQVNISRFAYRGRTNLCTLRRAHRGFRFEVSLSRFAGPSRWR